MPDTTPTLMSHQQQVHDFLVDHPFAAGWLGVGSGKTATTLSVLQTVRPAGHILVVAPVAIARSTWLDEIDKWGFPIRTRSLIVNENDKQLSKQKRLQRFQEVFSDPPTMYFINQELLSMPSQGERLIEADPTAGTRAGSLPLDAVTRDVLHTLTVLGPSTRDELVQAHQQSVSSATGKTMPKKYITSAITELVGYGLAVREHRNCRACDGRGCRNCRFGLVDQMPTETVDGQERLLWPFQTLIIDESQGFKSHASNRFKALAAVRPAMNRIIELTGTPAPNGLHDLWSQIYLLDQGAALGRNITTYRNRWFTPVMVPGTTTPASWVPALGAEEEIHRSISHLVISAENSNLTMPELTINDVNVTLPTDLMQTYKDFKKNLVLDIIRPYVADDGTLTQGVESIIVDNQAVLTSKLMQFASGTLYTADPDDPSTSGQYSVVHDEKVQMAEYIVRNNGGSPVLLAYHFRSDREQLMNAFDKAGIDARVFNGSRQMVRDWNIGRIPVMLLHPASAGHGLNLQDGGHTMIWYTLPFSLEHYLQTNGRLHRTGQIEPVTIHRLITKGTHDERMPGVLRMKKQVQDNLIDAVAVEAADEEALLAELETEAIDELNDMWMLDRV